MSNHLAIAAVTASLQGLLTRALQPSAPDITVTTKPLDRARVGETHNQVNLFLYQVSFNAALRNSEIPRQGKAGEDAPAPVALELSYLLTVYAQGDDGTDSQKLLGRSMQALHDGAVLLPADIRTALAGNDLYRQTERVRIRPEPISLEELSKLWATFQTQYRLSTGYRVSVVLIDSARPARAPLPVLSVKAGVQPSPLPPYPFLTSARPPRQQVGVRPGETLTLSGGYLDAGPAQAQVMTARWAQPVTVPAQSVSWSEVGVVVPASDPAWLAGQYTISVVVLQSQQPRISNDLPWCLSPKIDNIAPPNPARDRNGRATFKISCSPSIGVDQRASVLLAGREIVLPARTVPQQQVDVVVDDAPAGTHFIRLRVDGVDSELIDHSVSPPVFDPSQVVTIR